MSTPLPPRCLPGPPLSGTEAFGLYHATAEGSCSWYAFAREIFDLAGVEDHHAHLVSPHHREDVDAALRAGGRLTQRGHILAGFAQSA